MDKYLQDQHIQLYEKDDLKTDIWIKNGQITVKKYDNRIGHQLFIFDNITLESIKKCFENRAITKKRSNISEILQKLKLSKYDAYEIIKKTHGISSADFFWFKFDDENIKYEDIILRNV